MCKVDWLLCLKLSAFLPPMFGLWAAVVEVVKVLKSFLLEFWDWNLTCPPSLKDPFNLSQCIAKHHATSCSNFNRVKMYELFGKIIWLKFALIEATNFISRRFGLMTFFKTVCFHTGQDKNSNTMKGWWKLRESFHPPFTLRTNYIK